LYYRREKPGEFAGFLEQTYGDFAAVRWTTLPRVRSRLQQA
jgi:hypothetical protein